MSEETVTSKTYNLTEVQLRKLLNINLKDKTHCNDWKIKNLLGLWIIEKGGNIFGGWVRDKYLHDEHSKKFYDVFEKDIGLHLLINLYYKDISFLPEYIGRLTIPSDIDVFIKRSDFEALLKDVYADNIKLIFVNEREFILKKKNWIDELEEEMNEYIKSFVISQKITHYKYEVCSVQNRNYTILFEIDFLVIEEGNEEEIPDAPFQCLDFECNSLIMDKNGIRLSKFFLPKIIEEEKRKIELDRVLNDILQFKAITCKNVKQTRINKMLRKKWNIVDLSKIDFISVSSDDPEEKDVCNLCLDNFSSSPTHYKLKCCNTHLHKKCLIDLWSKNFYHSNCIYCKSNLSNNTIYNYSFIKLLKKDSLNEGPSV
jgi:hypothetical protein